MSPHDGKAATAPEPTVFSEPWQALAFAMVLSVHDRGLFGWDEWAAALSAELKRPGVAENGSDYYECWRRALETLLGQKSITDTGAIEHVAAAWTRAAHATPHGQPILLQNAPERAGPAGDSLLGPAGTD